MKRVIILILIMFFVFALYLALYAGYNDTGVNLLYKTFNLSSDTDSMLLTLFRYPRALKAVIAGSCLALAGMFMQAITKNPLAEPYVTGVSAGAGLGIVFSILVLNSSNFSFFGFIGALIVSLLVVCFSGFNKFSIAKLILVGLSINVFSSALMSFLILLNPEKSYTILLILSGGVTNNEIISNKILFMIFLIVILLCVYYVPKLNFLRLDTDLLAVNRKKKILYTISIIVLSAFLTSISVFAAGILGFVGIIVPQISKILLGQDYRYLFFSNLLIGSGLILIADYFARTIIYPLQVPLGVVISFIGAPIFVYFLTKKGDLFND